MIVFLISLVSFARAAAHQQCDAAFLGSQINKAGCLCSDGNVTHVTLTCITNLGYAVGDTAYNSEHAFFFGQSAVSYYVENTPGDGCATSMSTAYNSGGYHAMGALETDPRCHGGVLGFCDASAATAEPCCAVGGCNVCCHFGYCGDCDATGPPTPPPPPPQPPGPFITVPPATEHRHKHHHHGK